MKYIIYCYNLLILLMNFDKEWHLNLKHIKNTTENTE